ncbi:hypothetical protein [Salinicola rhizosphaerae]|uniref:Uncharacterized protein n=1 Tax=Salinicola rhizosphaerae TaxID=1443141 RepID=A0ABQ3DS72_9GAMM|nr:hypothetical protein [Salinicola rhizosphaerae]GHB12963.1 hypothetical protein GCM10009038_08770 [Salinicola rhizosphaerae]
MENEKEESSILGKLFLWAFLISVAFGGGGIYGYLKGYELVKNMNPEVEKVVKLNMALEKHIIALCTYSEMNEEGIDCKRSVSLLEETLKQDDFISKEKLDAYISNFKKNAGV